MTWSVHHKPCTYTVLDYIYYIHVISMSWGSVHKLWIVISYTSLVARKGGESEGNSLCNDPLIKVYMHCPSKSSVPALTSLLLYIASMIIKHWHSFSWSAVYINMSWGSVHKLWIVISHTSLFARKGSESEGNSLCNDSLVKVYVHCLSKSS